jgi:hypothetical protein
VRPAARSRAGVRVTQIGPRPDERIQDSLELYGQTVTQCKFCTVELSLGLMIELQSLDESQTQEKEPMGVPGVYLTPLLQVVPPERGL